MYKDVVPTPEDYTIQAHAISRSAQAMPVQLRRLVYLVMAQVRPGDASFMEIHMKVGDIARALGMSDKDGIVAGPVYERIRASVLEGLKEIIEIKQADGKWTAFQWFARAQYDPKTDHIQIRLHDDLRPYVLEVQRAFRPFAIKDIAKLQGKYALRVFELVMTREGQASKTGRWWYEVEINELRTMFKVGPNEYTRTNDFRVRTIEDPIREINNAELGIFISPKYVRQGRRLVAVRFNCQKLQRGEARPVTELTDDELEDEIFINTHKQEFDQILKQVKEDGELFPLAGYSTPTMRELAQTAEAIKRLKLQLYSKKHREKKTRNIPPKKK
jgi:plasmid replication initiation protein